MLIVWGTKVTTKRLGYVAELCPSCRRVTEHQFGEIVHAGHVYYVRTERGKVVGYSVTCKECKQDRQVAPERYAGMSRKPAPLDLLQAATHPGIAAQAAALHDRDKRAQRSELSPQERLAVMQESLARLEQLVEARAAAVHFDLRSGLLGLTALSLPWILVAQGMGMPGIGGSILVWTGLGSFALSLGFFFHALKTDPRRFIQRKLAGDLRRQLAGFHPSPSELAELVASMKAAGWALGKKLDPDWLTAELYRQDAVDRTPTVH